MTPTFEKVSTALLATLPTTIRRNGKPLAPNSIRIYTHCATRLNEHLGKECLPISNKRLRDYVAALRAEGYSDSSIVGDLTAYSLAVESLTDENGDALFLVKLNHNFINTPVIRPLDQRGPCASREDIERAVRLPILAPIVAIAAGAGLRVSEILALHHNDSARDSWDSETATISVRVTLKTPAAKRDIPITKELNDFLQAHTEPGGRLFGTSLSNVYKLLDRAALPPMHSFRRFRISTWDKAGMNQEVCKRLAGHSKGGDIHNRYKFAEEDAEFARAEVERCGLGFSLPVEVK